MSITSYKTGTISPSSLLAGNIPFALTWSSATAGSTNTLGSNIGFGANIFLIGPRLDNNNYFTSSNGTSWTERTSPGAVDSGGWAGSYFVLFDFGSTTFYKSSDGISWTSGTVSPALKNGRYSGNIRYDATSGVSIMSVNEEFLEYVKSTDGGSSWAKGGNSSGTGFNGVQIAHNDNGKWAYSGELSQLYYSSDASSWTQVTSTPSGNAGAVFGGGGLFIWRSDTAGTTYYTSTDAISWTSRTFPVSGVYQFGWNGTRWIAIVNSGTESYHSVDGINWIAATNSKSNGTTNQYAMVANSFTGAGKMVAPLRATNTVNYASI
jgi:hypothetical protein